ncbi:hypothetical protein DCO56_02315 [Sphingobacterium athyrii]|uniref:Uncharacterized protein n=1 Tax=Sphingobacterium athyrii TaxID=2152717 RepID=A0A363NYP1_9SPHI|nr:hypothetical protein DCO56_02315 [Sphingobacterium athyrii]
MKINGINRIIIEVKSMKRKTGITVLKDLITPSVFKKVLTFKRNGLIKSSGTVDSKIHFIKKGSIFRLFWKRWITIFQLCK